MLEVLSPFSGEPVASLPFDEGAALEASVDRACRVARAWGQVPVQERVRRLAQGLAWFRQSAEQVARDITLQMGKPIREARAELEAMFERAEHMLQIAPECLAPDLLPPRTGFHRRIEHVPLGVVLNLAAWNYPLLIAVNVVVPALLAGNAVLLKHSAQTPLCGAHFATAFGRLAPEGLVTNLVLTHDETARLIGDPRVDHVAFTGSVEGGRRIVQAASRRFIDVGLELGGKDPAYVAGDADLDFVVPNVVEGACYNAGQSCCAIERVYVHASLYEEFLQRAKQALRAYRTGDPLDERTTLGPLAREAALGELEHQVEDAVGRGARLLAGGKRQGRFFPPTLLADCPNDARVMQEESFGPLVPVAPVAGDAEALARMNDSRFGLTASVWTRDRARAERLARDLVAGTIFQNRCDYLDPALPWTGCKESGRGSTLSRYGFLQLTRRRSIHFRD